jgi:hypothetical protein
MNNSDKCVDNLSNCDGSCRTDLTVGEVRIAQEAQYAPKVHIFAYGSRDAYNLTQVEDGIKDGDVLIVPSEGIVGIMVEAWPCALTSENGAFHRTTDGMVVSKVLGAKYNDSINLANEYIDRTWSEKYLLLNGDVLRERHNVHI